MRFLITLLLLALIEISLIVEVGKLIGALSTFVLLVLSALTGLQLLRLQGFATLVKLTRSMQQGDAPAQDILAAMLLAVVGLLLIIPGFFTSLLGFIGLLPFVRNLAAKQWLKRQLRNQPVTIIDADFYQLDDDAPAIEIFSTQHEKK